VSEAVDIEGTLDVLEPGLHTSIQDAGRPAWTHLGVPIGGACDRWSLAVANVLAGNEPDAPALEMTLVGPVLAVRSPIVVGLAGADLGAVVRETGERLAVGRSHRLAAGLTLAFPGSSDVLAAAGARGYLALAGGIDVPLVLDSASTLVSARLGGFDGRTLLAGDTLRSRPPYPPVGSAAAARGPRSWPSLPGDPFAASDGPDGPTIGLLPGPRPGFEALLDATWRVASGSDRVGLRLDRPVVRTSADGEQISHGVVRGAVQVPPDGVPIILLADHQTTGGYPVVAVAITADHPRLGQLRPGGPVRFRVVTDEQAQAALVAQRAAFDDAAAMLRDSSRWDDLWQSAGG
jgi:antagonist of KipI